MVVVMALSVVDHGLEPRPDCLIIYSDHIGGVMVVVMASSVVDHGLEPRPDCLII
jgi:hypothetical protein